MAKSAFMLPGGEGFYWKSDIIYCSFRVNGQRFQMTTGFTGRESSLLVKLRQFKQQQIVEATKLTEENVKRGVRVAELFTNYIEHLQNKEEQGDEYAKTGRRTSNRTESVIRCHLDFFNDLRPEQIRERLADYRKKRHEEGVKPPAWNGELRILRAAVNRGVKSGLMRREHCPAEYPFNYKGERKARRKGIITPEQEAIIMDELARHLKPVFAVSVVTGIRPKELRFIRPGQVILDGKDPHIQLREGETKNGDARKVALVDDVIPVLKGWRQYSEETYPQAGWFFHHKGHQLGEWKTAWDAALVRCGLRVQNDQGEWENAVIFYDSRRTARTRLDMAGVSQSDAKKQLGHKTDAMSEGYDQSTAHLQRIRQADKGKSAPVAPASSVDVVDAKLVKLKQRFEAGLIPESIYLKQVEALVSWKE
jgi:integrase